MRTICYNVYGCHGWSSDPADPGAGSKSVLRRMAKAMAVLDPDLLTLSEAPNSAITCELGDLLGLETVILPSGGKWPGALLTRFRVLDVLSGTAFSDNPELFTRHTGRITVDTPGGDLVLYSAHLHPSEPDLRQKEVSHLLRYIQRDMAEGRDVILQGDLNHEPEEPEFCLWQEAGLVDTWTAIGSGSGLTFQADLPTRRIDYIWASPSLATDLRHARVVHDFPFGSGNRPADSRSYLSDHLPVLAEFRSEPGA